MCTNIQHWADYHQKWKKRDFFRYNPYVTNVTILYISAFWMDPYMGPFRTQAFEHCYDGYWWERELPYLRNRLNSQLRTGGQGRAYNTMWKNTIVNYAWNTKGNSQYFHQRITEWEQKYCSLPGSNGACISEHMKRSQCNDFVTLNKDDADVLITWEEKWERFNVFFPRLDSKSRLDTYPR